MQQTKVCTQGMPKWLCSCTKDGHVSTGMDDMQSKLRLHCETGQMTKPECMYQWFNLQ